MVAYSRATLERWAFTDELTGISNRRRFGLAQRGRARRWYVAIDLDGFKRAQDKPGRGHSWGDRCLRNFARWLQANTRPGDGLCARLGGDEFGVVVDSEDAARAIAARVAGWSFREVRASAGVGKTFKRADLALYLQKAMR